MEPLSFMEVHDETTVHTIYAGLYIHGASCGQSVRLRLNPQLRRGRSRFKFKWPDDLEASVIKARIMDWRGRETVSGFGHSLLHGISVPRCFNIFLHEGVKYGRSRIQRSRWLELMDAHGIWHRTSVSEGGKLRKDSNLVLQFIRFCFN